MNYELLQISIFRAAEFTFSRSSGAGGQNVNKVSTRVTISLSVDSLEGLSDEERAAVKVRLANRIGADGRLSLSAQDTRSQAHNRELALERLENLLFEALKKRKNRRPTRPSAAARARRLESKRRGGRRKAARRAPSPDD